MVHIKIVSGNQLSDSPRVVKEAATLCRAGFDVEVLTSVTNNGDDQRNSEIAYRNGFRARRIVDASSSLLRNKVLWMLCRGRRFVSNKLALWLRHYSVRQLGYVGPEMLKLCLREPADLYSVHVESGTWVGYELLKRGKQVYMDVEDWYSQDLRQEDRQLYPIDLLQKWESGVLRNCKFASTTSQSLSSAISLEYRCRPPVVLYNAFGLAERGENARPPHLQDRSKTLPSICWVSQVIGPDRGLEQLVAATHLINRPIAIHLRGSLRPGFDNQLRMALHERCQIRFYAQTPHHQLLPFMQEHDIGFAGELADNRNKDLTVSNKILHYLLAGIPTVASDTAGQLEICRQAPEATRVYAQRDPRSLAAAIDSLTADDVILKAAKAAAWKLGTEKFCWEVNEPVLLEAVENALSGKA